MKKKIITILGILFVIAVFASIFSLNTSAKEIIAPCKMESELDVYAGAGYYSNLRNPVVKGDSFKVVSLEWSVNKYRKDYREDFAYSSSQKIFAEDTAYYLKLTLHSLNYPNAEFSSSLNAADFSGFTVSLKQNGVSVELQPHAVDNYDSTHEYITLIYKVETQKAETRVAVTGVNMSVNVIQVGKSFIFPSNVSVEPINATNQYIEWIFLNGEDGGTNYCIKKGEYYLLLTPMEGYTPKAGTFTLVAQIPGGKENGSLYATTIKFRIVNDISLQGNVIIPSEPVYGEKTKVVVDGEAKNLNDLKYIWEYKNSSGVFDSVTKVKNYGTINDNLLTPGIGLVGKEIRLRITSSTYMGAIVSESKIVNKSNTMASPCGFICGFSSSSGICAVINSDTHLLQEFILLKSSNPPTEEQWASLAKSPSSKNDLYFPTDENGNAIVGSTTYTIYSRFKATDRSNAGTEIISATYYTGFKCSLNVSGIKLNYLKVEYEPYDTIIVDLMGDASVTFAPSILTGPSNANEWRKHVWKLTGSEAVDFYGVGNSSGPYYTTLDYQSGNEYYTKLKAVFTKQGKYYLSADIDGSADKYAYYTIIVIDSTKHIDEYVVSVRPSNSTPTTLSLEKNGVLIPSFVSNVSIYPTAAQKDYKIIYKEATYKSGAFGAPYNLTDNEYIDVDEKTGAITGIKKTGNAVGEKGYVCLCIYDTTTKKTTIVSGISVTVTEPTHTHFLTKISAKKATCTESGYSKTFYVCSCGNWYSDANAKNLITNHESCIENELGHNYGDFIIEVSPTHSSNGTVGHYHCSRCNQDFDFSKNLLSSIVIDNSNHRTELSKWTFDDEYHWHSCVLGGCDAKLDKAKHSANSVGDKCEICGAEMEKTDKESLDTAKDTVATDKETTNMEADTTEAVITEGDTTVTQPDETSIAESTDSESKKDEITESDNSYVLYIIICVLAVVVIVVIAIIVSKKKK